MTSPSEGNAYSAESIVNRSGLPDPFALPTGGRLRNRVAWHERAAAWRDLILDMEYGGIPPPP